MQTELIATETAMERWARSRRENNEARIAREAYRADKQHLRPRPGDRLPRWAWKMLHRAHPEGGVYSFGGWHGLQTCARECVPSQFVDHSMVSLDGHLVLEPYMPLETARHHAAEYAASHGLQFAVSPIAWWNDGCVRVEFFVGAYGEVSNASL